MNTTATNAKNSMFFFFMMAALFVIMWSSGYSLREGEQAVVTLFGKPVRTQKEAGLHWKLPFFESLTLVDLRLLNWDGYPTQIPTRDKKYITVDTTARLRIVDPLKFIQTVQNERGAKSRLDAILDATTRNVISSHALVEAVRNSNSIFETAKKRAAVTSAASKAKAAQEEAGSAVTVLANIEEEEVIGEIEAVEIGRERLSRLIIESAAKELVPIGIELIDVQLRRIMYEASVEKKVYTRMISERERIAEKIRSIGKGEQAKIEGKTSRELQEIQSGAYRAVQKIKGEAEAKAIAIYAETLSKDPSFYEFTRKLEAYRSTIGTDTRLVLSSSSDFFSLLKKEK